MLCINQVSHGVHRSVKDGSCSSSSLELKSMDNFLMGYLTISTNVRCYQTRHRWQLFLSGRQRTGALCVTQSNWVKMWFSCFRVLPGSAEAQVIWGGIVKRLLIASFIGNIFAKKYQNPFMCVKVIASQRWDVFETRCGIALEQFTLHVLDTFS